MTDPTDNSNGNMGSWSPPSANFCGRTAPYKPPKMKRRGDFIMLGIVVLAVAGLVTLILLTV